MLSVALFLVGSVPVLIHVSRSCCTQQTNTAGRRPNVSKKRSKWMNKWSIWSALLCTLLCGLDNPSSVCFINLTSSRHHLTWTWVITVSNLVFDLFTVISGRWAWTEPNRTEEASLALSIGKEYRHSSCSFDFSSCFLKQIYVWKSWKHDRDFMHKKLYQWRHKRGRHDFVAKRSNTSWANLVLLFFGEERMNMAAPWGAQIRSTKVLPLYKFW